MNALGRDLADALRVQHREYERVDCVDRDLCDTGR